MSDIRVERPSGTVSARKREYALLQQLGNGTGEFDVEVRLPYNCTGLGARKPNHGASGSKGP